MRKLFYAWAGQFIFCPMQMSPLRGLQVRGFRFRGLHPRLDAVTVSRLAERKGMSHRVAAYGLFEFKMLCDSMVRGTF
jgi:hypothetical protein